MKMFLDFLGLVWRPVEGGFADLRYECVFEWDELVESYAPMHEISESFLREMSNTGAAVQCSEDTWVPYDGLYYKINLRGGILPEELLCLLLQEA